MFIINQINNTEGILMKTLTKSLLVTSLVATLLAGQVAIAGEEAPRDAYSIGLVWAADTADTAEAAEASRVNYSLDDTSVSNSDSYFQSENR